MFEPFKPALCRFACDHAFKAEEQQAEATPPQEPTLVPDHAGIVLPTGDHTITISLDYQPEAVYLHLDSEDAQVCGASGVDMAGVTIGVEQFSIYASIKSNLCNIRWAIL